MNYEKLTKKQLIELLVAEEKTIIKDSDDVTKVIRDNIAYKETENFMALYLRTDGSIIKKEILFKGGYNASTVDIRVVLKKALMCNAVNIIVAHNHPSGSTNPSEEDIILTKKLKESCNLMNIQLLDHIIVTSNSHYSFKTNGLV